MVPEVVVEGVTGAVIGIISEDCESGSGFNAAPEGLEDLGSAFFNAGSDTAVAVAVVVAVTVTVAALTGTASGIGYGLDPLCAVQFHSSVYTG